MTLFLQRITQEGKLPALEMRDLVVIQMMTLDPMDLVGLNVKLVARKQYMISGIMTRVNGFRN
jgi:hypothetical protein